METVPGWAEPLDDCSTIGDLPEAARAYVRLVERALDMPVRLVGTKSRASRCSRRPKFLDHLPGIDVDVVDLPGAAAEEEPFGGKRRAISVVSPFSVSALTVPISWSAGSPGDHDFVGSQGKKIEGAFRPEASL